MIVSKILGLLDRIDKWLPAGHIGITPGEISPNSGPIDVPMSFTKKLNRKRGDIMTVSACVCYHRPDQALEYAPETVG